MTYPSNSESVAPDQLRAFVERIERMHEERRAIGDDIKEIYAEAKGNGFDTKALKIVIRHREQDVAERMELEAIVDLYKSALGMQDDHAVPAPARTREIIEEFDAETGEIIEPDVPKPLPVVADEATVTDPATPIPTAAENALQLRPFCLHADDLSKCGGMGRRHCYSCEKAHADSEGFSA